MSMKKVYGFIAQDVREVIPEAIKIKNEYIPNIFDSATFSSNVLTFHNKDLDTTYINIGSNIQIYDYDTKLNICKITDFTSNTITIDKPIENSCNLCFAHSCEVNDFHALDKNYIYTINVCATQELYRIIQQQEERIKHLEAILQIHTDH